MRVVADLVHAELKLLEVFAALIKIVSQNKFLVKMEKAQQRVVLRGEERGGRGKGGVRERGKGREERKGEGRRRRKGT